MAAGTSLPTLTRLHVVDLLARRRAILRRDRVELPELEVAVVLSEVPARLRLELEDVTSGNGRGAFEGVPWIDRVAHLIAMTACDDDGEPLVALDDPDQVEEFRDLVRSLPTRAAVELFNRACDVNRLGAAGVETSAGESEGGPNGDSSSGSPAT